MKYARKFLFSLILSILLSYYGGTFSLAAESTASAMQLAKTEGTVDISTSTGKEVPVLDNMRLYNGYALETADESYAWISLDSVKMAKLDAVSGASVRKHGKKLEILLDSGNIFFNVGKPLEEDESFYIRTSTMGIGIRGTCGWVEIADEKEARVYVLEGTVEVSVTDPVSGQIKTGVVSGGEHAVCVVYEQTKPGDKCDILKDGYSGEDVSGFALVEVAGDPGLAESIYEKTGGDLDLRDVTVQEAQMRLEDDNGETAKKLAKAEVDIKEQENKVSADPVWEFPGSKPKPSTQPSAKPAQQPAAAPESGGESGGALKPSKPSKPSKPKPATCTVTFDSNGGSEVDDKIVEQGKSVAKPADPTRDGYAFGGWFKDSECAREWDFGTDSVTGDVTLYAKWIAAGENPEPDDRLKWSLDDAGTLTISGNGDMPNYGRDMTVKAAPWYNQRDSIKQVVIENGVTSIGSEAFLDCMSLTSVSIPNSVASIGYATFWGCSSLTSVSIPDSVTSIGGYAFYGCYILTSISIPDSVTSIGDYAFDVCRSLTSVSIPNSVTSIGQGVFYMCSSLTAINVDESNMVYCSEDGVLFNKGKSTLIAYPRGKGASYTIPDSVISIGGGAFELCSSLSSVTIPNSVTSIGNGAFAGCSNLTTVNYTGTQTDWNNITKGTDCFPSGINIVYNYAVPTSASEETIQALEEAGEYESEQAATSKTPTETQEISESETTQESEEASESKKSEIFEAITESDETDKSKNAETSTDSNEKM